MAKKGRCLRCNTHNSSQWLFDTLQLCIILQPPISLLRALCPYYVNWICVIDLSWNDLELVYWYFACIFMYMIVKLHCIHSVVTLVLISPNCCISRPGFLSKKKWVLLSVSHGVMGIIATMDVIVVTSITCRHASLWYCMNILFLRILSGDPYQDLTILRPRHMCTSSQCGHSWKKIVLCWYGRIPPKWTRQHLLSNSSLVAYHNAPLCCRSGEHVRQKTCMLSLSMHSEWSVG